MLDLQLARALRYAKSEQGILAPAAVFESLRVVLACEKKTKMKESESKRSSWLSCNAFLCLSEDDAYDTFNLSPHTISVYVDSKKNSRAFQPTFSPCHGTSYCTRLDCLGDLGSCHVIRFRFAESLTTFTQKTWR